MVNILQDSAYHIQRPYMSKTATICQSNGDYYIQCPHMNREQTEVFQYPCVYSVKKDGTPTFWYSSRNDRGHFGLPKVIWGDGTGGGLFVDYNGDYALTEFAYGIVDDPKNFPDIVKAMSSQKFRDFMVSIPGGNSIFNYKVIRLFKKEFWEEFV